MYINTIGIDWYHLYPCYYLHRKSSRVFCWIPLYRLSMLSALARLRYITSLQKGLADMDSEYDKCHTVYTSGEGSQWKEGLLVYHSSLHTHIYNYILDFSIYIYIYVYSSSYALIIL